MPKQISLEGHSAEEISGLAAASKMLSENPATKRAFLKLLKQADPTVNLPELDLDERIEAATASSETKLAELQDKLRERDARDKWAELRAEPVKMGLLSNEEIPDLEKYMKDNGFSGTQYVQAAKMRQLESQLAEPTSSSMASPYTVDFDKGLRSNPKAWAKTSAFDAINDLRSGKAKH